MATRLLLVAHGETAAIRAAAFPRDESLDPRGLAAAQAMALPSPRPRTAWTSSAPAAIETAAALGLEARVDDALRDLDVGRWRGLPLADVAATEPEAFAAWIADPASASHGGEPVDALIRRVEAWLATRLGDKGVTIAITHAAVMRAALVATLGAPGAAFWRIDVAPLAVLAFSTDGRRWSLRAPQPSSL